MSKISRKDKTLYQNLMNLCSNTETLFHFVDHVTPDGLNIRVFDYHYASYSDWQLPDALWCRGITFVIEQERPVKLLCLPMKKFFNLNENPFTMDLNLNDIQWYEEKRDGSLISSLQDASGIIRLKSKTTLASVQAQEATAWLYMPEHSDLLEFIQLCESQNCTVNLEWTSPRNRVVLPYQEDVLQILNVIDRDTREMVDLNELYSNPTFVKYSVERFDAPENPTEWVDSVMRSKDIEGFIVYHKRCIFKLKTEWYCNLHRNKSDVLSSDKSRLWLVANGDMDDLIALLDGDQYAIDLIQKTERHYKNLIQTVLIDVSEAKKHLHLERKNYVGEVMRICKQSKLSFSVCMKLHSNHNLDVVKYVQSEVKRVPKNHV